MISTNMMKLDIKKFFKTEGTWVQEASTLGIAPDGFPNVIEAEGILYHYASLDMNQSGVAGVRYLSDGGDKMLIIND